MYFKNLYIHYNTLKTKTNKQKVQNSYSGKIVYQHESLREKCTHIYLFQCTFDLKTKKMWLYPSSFSSWKQKNVALSSETYTPLSYILLWKATERDMTPVLWKPSLEKNGLTWFKILNKHMPTRLVSPSASVGGQETNVFFVLPHICTTIELTRSCFGSFMYIYFW